MPGKDERPRKLPIGEGSCSAAIVVFEESGTTALVRRGPTHLAVRRRREERRVERLRRLLPRPEAIGERELVEGRAETLRLDAAVAGRFHRRGDDILADREAEPLEFDGLGAVVAAMEHRLDGADRIAHRVLQCLQVGAQKPPDGFGFLGGETGADHDGVAV